MTRPRDDAGSQPAQSKPAQHKDSKSKGGSQQTQSGDYTARTWAIALLKRLGAPTTEDNVRAIMSWEVAEGGHWENTATYNPLNTTQNADGASSMNGVGVKAYTSWDQGLTATVQTLTNGNYAPILHALHTGKDAAGVLQAVTASPWSSYPNGINLIGSNNSYGTGPGQTSGGAGQVVGGGAGGAAGNAELTKQDVSAALDSLGFPKALIESNPGLHKAFNEILNQQLDLSTTEGQNRAMQLLKATDWWKKRDDSQRKFDAAMVDPAEHKSLLREIAQKQADIATAAKQLGMPLDPDKLNHLATIAVRNGLDANELNNALVGHFKYQQDQSYSGTIGSDVQGLQQLAGEYFINLGPQRMQHLLSQMLQGQLQPQDMADYLKQMAIGKYPSLEKQLNKGMTVADVAAPYMQSYTDILGVNPASIGIHDPLLNQALAQPDGNGGFQLMPLWQFEQQLRKDPRWLNTDNAKHSLMDTGIQILKDWGLAS